MRGMALPIRVTPSGGAALVENSDQIEKLLITALQPCQSDNPFQELGLAADIIFRINDKNIEAEITLEVERIFTQFEKSKRAKLVSIPAFTREDGELQMTIEWADLETGRRRVLTTTIPSGVEGF